MKLFRNLDSFPETLRNGALTIGNFDGVHRGHATIINRLKHHADKLGTSAIVFTFDPHPVRVLAPQRAPVPLTWTNRKADLLAELGVDVVIAYPTDKDLLALTHGQFFQQIIVDQIGAKAMVEGPNFFFGKDRGGNVDVLADLCGENKMALEIMDPVSDQEPDQEGDPQSAPQDHGELISSSRIRKLVAEGDVDAAAAMLTHPYRIRGMVTHGMARGAKLGFPTANLDAIDTLVPGKGVYAGRTWIDGRSHWSAIHIGPNPTFGENVLKVESHILDFEGSLYGQAIEVDFISRLRDILDFGSREQLQQQLQKDIAGTRRIARNYQ